MHGIGLDLDVREWFDPRPASRHGRTKGTRRRATRDVPRTTVPPDLIERSLA